MATIRSVRHTGRRSLISVTRIHAHVPFVNRPHCRWVGLPRCRGVAAWPDTWPHRGAAAGLSLCFRPLGTQRYRRCTARGCPQSPRLRGRAGDCGRSLRSSGPGWFKQAQPSGPPPLDEVGDILALAPRHTSWIVQRFTPGSYAALCFFTDPKTHLPHVALGMVAPFTVR